MNVRRLFEHISPKRKRFLVLSKFISPLDEVTWRPERLFRKLEEAERHIREEVRGIGLPSWNWKIRRPTRKERRAFRD